VCSHILRVFVPPPSAVVLVTFLTLSVSCALPLIFFFFCLLIHLQITSANEGPLSTLPLLPWSLRTLNSTHHCLCRSLFFFSDTLCLGPWSSRDPSCVFLLLYFPLYINNSHKFRCSFFSLPFPLCSFRVGRRDINPFNHKAFPAPKPSWHTYLSFSDLSHKTSFCLFDFFCPLVMFLSFAGRVLSPNLPNRNLLYLFFSPLPCPIGLAPVPYDSFPCNPFPFFQTFVFCFNTFLFSPTPKGTPHCWVTHPDHSGILIIHLPTCSPFFFHVYISTVPSFFGPPLRRIFFFAPFSLPIPFEVAPPCPLLFHTYSSHLSRGLLLFVPS